MSDEEATHQIPVTEWLPPVDSPEALPKTGVNEGAFCFVQTPKDEATWQYRRGKWVRIVRER